MRLCSGGKRWAGVCPTSTEGITGVGGRPGDGYRHPEAWTCETDHPPRGEEAWLRGVPGSRAGPARPPGRSILNSKQGDLPGVLVCSYACCPPACTAPPSSLLPEQPANTHTHDQTDLRSALMEGTGRWAPSLPPLATLDPGTGPHAQLGPFQRGLSRAPHDFCPPLLMPSSVVYTDCPLPHLGPNTLLRALPPLPC